MNELHALVISTEGRIEVEEYGFGYGPDKPHALYSGTKSFWGVAALEAAREAILDLDASVAGHLPEFAAGARAKITPRMLLQMTAGYGFGGLGKAVPTYDRALDIELKNAPGTTFTYGGIPLQVFGACFARALSARNQTPHDYLRETVLKPAGVEVAAWRELSDGTHPLPTGASLTARAWLAYGRYVLENHARYADAFRGSAANARYGLCWWLAPPRLPEDIFYASGAAGQALYVIPSRTTVVVRFGKSTSHNHATFLKRLLA
jgi:CubicO group peptidase (beta-lactamase class C family)